MKNIFISKLYKALLGNFQALLVSKSTNLGWCKFFLQIYALWNNKVSTLKKTSLEVIGIAVLTIAATDCWVGCAQECHKDRWAINFLTTPPSEILGFFAPEAKHQQWVFLAFERYVNFSMATPAAT